jgi:hypothetical protein
LAVSQSDCPRNIKRPSKKITSPGHFIIQNYFCCGASTGHTFAHAPHSIQASSSITYLESPADMHDTGHSASQAPQLMQSSVIKYAIISTSQLKYIGNQHINN